MKEHNANHTGWGRGTGAVRTRRPLAVESARPRRHANTVTTIFQLKYRYFV